MKTTSHKKIKIYFDFFEVELKTYNVYDDIITLLMPQLYFSELSKHFSNTRIELHEKLDAIKHLTRKQRKKILCKDFKYVGFNRINQAKNGSVIDLLKTQNQILKINGFDAKIIDIKYNEKEEFFIIRCNLPNFLKKMK